MKIRDHEVDQKDLIKFDNEMHRLAKKRFGTFDDGNPYIKVHIEDRTRGLMPHFMLVPYSHLCDAREDYQSIFAACVYNLGCAMDMFNQNVRGMEHIFYHDTERRKLEAMLRPLFGKQPVIFPSGYGWSDEHPKWQVWRFRLDDKEDLDARMLRIEQDTKNKTIKDWVIKRVRALRRKFGKQICAWAVNTASGTHVYIYALVEIPERDRPRIILQRNVRHDVLKKYDAEIELEVARAHR